MLRTKKEKIFELQVTLSMKITGTINRTDEMIPKHPNTTEHVRGVKQTKAFFKIMAIFY